MAWSPGAGVILFFTCFFFLFYLSAITMMYVFLSFTHRSRMLAKFHIQLVTIFSCFYFFFFSFVTCLLSFEPNCKPCFCLKILCLKFKIYLILFVCCVCVSWSFLFLSLLVYAHAFWFVDVCIKCWGSLLLTISSQTHRQTIFLHPKKVTVLISCI